MPEKVGTRVGRCGLGSSAARILFGLSWCSLSLAASVQNPQSPSQPATATPSAPEVSIEAPEPRYVAPTLRDHIGRIWAPVLINGKGPFRLVLDTGANHSAVTATVAQALGIPMDEETSFQLQGVTGSATVPSIHVENLLVGDLMMSSAVLPIVPDALGGAQGVLGTEGLLDKRIFIDFLHDRISITRSHNARAPRGFVVIPVKISDQNLLITNAYVGGMRVTAIIDTGAQSSIANLALREDLQRHRSRYKFTDDEITGATDDVTKGQDAAFPPIGLGPVEIEGAHITTGDLQIFDVWKLMSTPAILIGMDALGTLDELVIDYRRHELQIMVRHNGITSSREYE